MFRLTESVTKENAEQLKLCYDVKGAKVDASENPEAVDGEIIIYLRQLNGHDARRMADMMVETDRKGKSAMKAGTVARAKVVNAVVAVDGIEGVNGNPVETITGAIYDKLPAWINEAILKKVNEMSALDDDEDEG